MKNFTSFIIVFLIAILASAQPTDLLIEKAEEAKKQLSKAEKAGMFLVNQNLSENFSSASLEYLLKSAAATHKLDSTVTWTSELGIEWEYEWKEEFYYNSSLKNNMWVDKEWDAATESWYVSAQTETEFDSEGKATVLYMWYRDEPGADLLLETKMEPEYNSSGKVETLFYHDTEDGGENWALQMEQVYAYNSSGKIEEVTLHTLVEGEMQETQRSVYTYEDGNMTMIQIYFMMEGEEFLTSETYLEYNNSGQLIIEEDWLLNYTTFELEKSSRIETEYTANGDVETEIWHDWDADAQVWVETEKDEYTYGSLSYADVIYPSMVFLYEYLAIEMPMAESKATAEIDTYTKAEDAWVQTENNVFYYSALDPSNAELVEKSNFDVYPNPVSETITISWTENHPELVLEMYRANGAKIMERQIFSGKSIEVKNLESGIYLYKFVNQNETVFTGKLVKQ